MVLAFIRKEMQKPRRLQPDCPVRLYSYMRSVEQCSGAHGVQLRFVNCAENRVDSLFLRICGLDESGTVCYTLPSVPLTGCAAEPRQVFGERKRLMLPSTPVAELEITVEWVLFSDGMLWKCLPNHRFDTPAALDMVQCTCGMWNGTEQARCAFCLAPMVPNKDEPVPSEPELPPVQTAVDGREVPLLPIPPLSMEELESMMQETAAILRSMQEQMEQ